jgi:hypothetical protein
LSCYVECIGDVIISVDDIIININDDNMCWWVYVLITIVIGVVIGGVIAFMFNWKRFNFEKEDELLPIVDNS